MCVNVISLAQSLSVELPDDEAKTQSKHKINEYMLRAEYLKEQMVEQNALKQMPVSWRATRTFLY